MDEDPQVVVAGRLDASFRDPSGFLFRRDGILYRQVNTSYREAYELLLGSTLYDELVEAGLLIPHAEAPLACALSPDAYRVLRPDVIRFISYPYSWCFSQLRDAALTTLAIQKRAVARGMILKDASAYNIQFHNGRPLMIDTLSFEPYREGEPWIAYRQFCQHFLAPLLLMSTRDVRLGALLRVHIDGIPLDLASTLLRRRSWLRASALLHVHLHARSIRRFATTAPDASPSATSRTRRMSRTSLLGLVDHLESAIRGLVWKAEGTEWADYTSEHSYSTNGMEDKERGVRELVARCAPRMVWDLGANTGTFSHIAAEHGAHVIAFDADPAAVERSYLRGRAIDAARVLPLLMDLTNPSSDAGWAHRERLSLRARGPADLVLALALVHHLAISNNVPLGDIARFFAELAPALIVEFVPKSDVQVARLLASRTDIFPHYTQEGFESAFGALYEIRETRRIRDSDRRLYLMMRRD